MFIRIFNKLFTAKTHNKLIMLNFFLFIWRTKEWCIHLKINLKPEGDKTEPTTNSALLLMNANF